MNQRPLARSEGLLTEPVGDELVVYDSVTRTAHCLSAGAVPVWELCDGRRAAADIAAQLGVDQEHVTCALDELDGAGLLDTVSRGQHAVSRREAAKRFVTIGAAAISAPLIYSVAIPHAAAAASGTGTGGTGGTDLCAGKVCNDNNICTVDECDALTGNCINTPISCNDNNPCTTDRCDRELGCVHTAVADGSPCNNGGTCQSSVCIGE
jgi:hypothetical protein